MLGEGNKGRTADGSAGAEAARSRGRTRPASAALRPRSRRTPTGDAGMEVGGEGGEGRKREGRHGAAVRVSMQPQPTEGRGFLVILIGGLLAGYERVERFLFPPHQCLLSQHLSLLLPPPFLCVCSAG